MIIIVENTKCLKKILALKRLRVNGESKYFSHRPLSPETLKYLKENKIRKLKGVSLDEEFKSQFVREYLSLVDSIGMQNNNKVWWATDVASKNRYSSMLPDLLEEYIVTLRSIQTEQQNNIIVVAPTWEMVPSLIDALDKLNIRSVYLGNRVNQRLRIMFLAVYKFGATLYNASKVLARTFWAKQKLQSSIKTKLKTTTPAYVIKTFLYNSSFNKNGEYQDTFFGRLPEFIKNNKETLILANVIGNYRFCVDAIARCSTYTIVPFELFLSFEDILQALRDVVFTKIKLNDARFYGEDVSKIVHNVLMKNFKGIKFPQFMHYWATKNFSKQVNCETFLMTYENYPWERMCILALREETPKTKIIGYQHTVVPQAYLNYFINENEVNLKLLPDRVLTTGAKTKDIMTRYGHYEGVSVEPSCGLRFEYLFQAPMTKQRRPIRKILIALESAWDAFELVEYVVNQLKDHPDIEVCIRTHSLLPWNRYIQRYGNPIKNYKNFKISNGIPLQDEINDADILIYWGTTVSLEALMMGKPIIHYNKGSVLSFDPLFECPYLKWNLDQDSSLLSTLHSIESVSDQEFDQQKEKAREYLREYFHPILEENLQKFAN